MIGTLGMQVVDTEAGVMVEAVMGEPARRTGIAKGDIIAQLDGKPLTSAAEFKTIAAALEAGKTVAARSFQSNHFQPVMFGVVGHPMFTGATPLV
ncbi:MAG: PDZ domain-containing protein [Candidatus Thiothrix sulfatifontis]|nr:MAG: PDZ domain-containing protein [Candidatus Thiothrix sulfatifontis]